MKTELEEYIERIDGFLDKRDKFVLEISKTEDGNAKSVRFYTPIEYKNPLLKEDTLVHFRFVSKNLDDAAIKDLERGLVNLAEKGYKIDYFNFAK